MKKKPGMVSEVYDKKAEKYDSLMSIYRYRQAVNDTLGKLATDIGPEAKILDLGCGTGFALGALDLYFDSYNMTGMDCSEEMLKICHDRFPQVRLLKADFNNGHDFRTFPGGRRQGLCEGSFDLVVSTGAVSEYAVLDKVVPWVHSLLKDDGKFINIGLKRNLVNMISGLIWHFDPRSEREFVQSCQEAGFSEVQNTSIHWKFFPTNALKYVVTASK